MGHCLDAINQLTHPVEHLDDQGLSRGRNAAHDLASIVCLPQLKRRKTLVELRHHAGSQPPGGEPPGECELVVDALSFGDERLLVGRVASQIRQILAGAPTGSVPRRRP
jgi:hypothetical protein